MRKISSRRNETSAILTGHAYNSQKPNPNPQPQFKPCQRPSWTNQSQGGVRKNSSFRNETSAILTGHAYNSQKPNPNPQPQFKPCQRPSWINQSQGARAKNFIAPGRNQCHFNRPCLQLAKTQSQSPTSIKTLSAAILDQQSQGGVRKISSRRNETSAILTGHAYNSQKHNPSPQLQFKPCQRPSWINQSQEAVRKIASRRDETSAILTCHAYNSQKPNPSPQLQFKPCQRPYWINQ